MLHIECMIRDDGHGRFSSTNSFGLNTCLRGHISHMRCSGRSASCPRGMSTRCLWQGSGPAPCLHSWSQAAPSLPATHTLPVVIV